MKQLNNFRTIIACWCKFQNWGIHYFPNKTTCIIKLFYPNLFKYLYHNWQIIDCVLVSPVWQKTFVFASLQVTNPFCTISSNLSDFDMLHEHIETELTLFLFCFSNKRLIAKMYRELYNDFDPNTKCALETEQNPRTHYFTRLSMKCIKLVSMKYICSIYRINCVFGQYLMSGSHKLSV